MRAEYKFCHSGFVLDDEKTTLTIYHKDLADWFNEHPANFEGKQEVCHVIPGKEAEFAHWILRRMMDDAPYEADDYVWTEPLGYAYRELLEDYKPEFLHYNEEYKEYNYGE